LDSKAKELIEEIKRFEKVLVVTHIDADGISAGAIACETLKRAGIEWDIEFVKQLDPETLKRISELGAPLVWFTDLGSGYKDEIGSLHAVVTDHHTPQGEIQSGGPVSSAPVIKKPASGMGLYAFDSPPDKKMDEPEPAEQPDLEPASGGFLELNPHNHGLDGATEMSGAGATYWLSRTWDKGNIDLAWLGILGATGDLQDMRERAFVGKNREIMEDGKMAGCLHWEKDFYIFGRDTRSIPKIIKYVTEPPIPGLSGDEKACIEFLSSLGLQLKTGRVWRSWVDLSRKEKQLVVSALIKRMLRSGYPAEKAMGIIGEVYSLPREKTGTELHNTKEFATLLNACGRYGNARVGFEICMGDRGTSLEKARDLLYNHRRNLVGSINVIIEQEGVTQEELYQYFHGRDLVLDSVIGTVASMILNSGKVPRGKTIFGFAETDEGMVKVSGRGTKKLVDQGLDLSELMDTVAKAIGGTGGGHNVAAGATIPSGTESEFLAKAEEILRRQLKTTT
jgi:RecJ-like exonuclease